MDRAQGAGWKQVIRGRGAVNNPANRFEKTRCDPFDDGWGALEAILTSEEKPTTEIFQENAKSIIATNDSPDIPFDRSINPYKGCEHGCVYCFARPSHGYWGWSPGLDFETKIVSKPNAAEQLEKAFRKKSYRCEPLALGSNTDPYQPIERSQKNTRRILEVLESFGHPVAIVTKSAGVLRDIDLLAKMAERKLAVVYLSITTLEPALAQKMEPRAAAPTRRIETLKQLAKAGVPVGVMLSPIIPAINDHELESIMEATHEVGVRTGSYMLVRLPYEVKTIFAEWLDQHYPDRKQKVLSMIKQNKGGKLNEPRFGYRMKGSGPFADLLRTRFQRMFKKLGWTRQNHLTTSRFQPPLAKGDQARLF